MTQELKPCPFCGGDEASPEDAGYNGKGFVRCLVCWSAGPEKDSKSEASEAWNRRAPITERQYCDGCDGYECQDGCAYPGAVPSPSIREAVEALRPFAKFADVWDSSYPTPDGNGRPIKEIAGPMGETAVITLGDCRMAKRFLASSPPSTPAGEKSE